MFPIFLPRITYLQSAGLGRDINIEAVVLECIIRKGANTSVKYEWCKVPRTTRSGISYVTFWPNSSGAHHSWRTDALVNVMKTRASG